MKKVVLTCLWLFGFFIVLAQNKDSISQDSTSQKKVKNLHWSLLGGPGYTPDLGFSLGITSLFSFRTNPKDTVSLPTVISTMAAILLGRGGVGFNVSSRPQFFFSGDNLRISGLFSYKQVYDNYYGVGYSTNKSRVRSDSTTLYLSSLFEAFPIVVFRIPKTNLFLGPMMDIVWEKVAKPAKGIIEDRNYKELGGDSTRLSMFNLGIGVSGSYDTRDFPINAYKGLYFDVKLTYYEPYLGSRYRFATLNVDYRQYYSFAYRKVLSWMISGKSSLGEVPFTRMPLSGSPFDLRGYYVGQYRDLSSYLAIIEYRQMFNTDRSTTWKKIVNRLGFVAWAGTGLIGPYLFKIEGTLPNIGLGVRFEVQPRINFRVDFGYNPIEKKTLLYFNMAEAF